MRSVFSESVPVSILLLTKRTKAFILYDENVPQRDLMFEHIVLVNGTVRVELSPISLLEKVSLGVGFEVSKDVCHSSVSLCYMIVSQSMSSQLLPQHHACLLPSSLP